MNRICFALLGAVIYLSAPVDSIISKKESALVALYTHKKHAACLSFFEKIIAHGCKCTIDVSTIKKLRTHLVHRTPVDYILLIDALEQTAQILHTINPTISTDDFSKCVYNAMRGYTSHTLDKNISVIELENIIENLNTAYGPSLKRGINDRLKVGDGAGNNVLVVTNAGDFTLNKSGVDGTTIIGASGGAVTINGSTSDAITIGNANTTTNAIKGATTTINAGTVTSTTSIADGITAASNTQTVNIGTGGTAAASSTKTIQIASDGTASGTETIALGKAGVTTTILGDTYINNSETAATYIGTSTSASAVHIADSTAKGAVTIGNTTGKVGLCGAVDATAKINVTGATTMTDALTVSSGGITETGSITITSGNLTLPATTGSTVGCVKFGSDIIFHNYGPNGTADKNLFVGKSAGNFTLTGTRNIGIGSSALDALTTGSANVGVGYNVMTKVQDGSCNVAIGESALGELVSGHNNVAIGYQALKNCTTSNNVAVGYNALLSNTSGTQNVALGENALANSSTGSNNIAVGYDAGSTYTGTQNSNICIGNAGSATDSHVIRIGTTGGGTLQQNKCYIRGIRGITTGGAAIAVLIDSNGQLGTVSSSIRFKEHVRDMGDDSSALALLQPVAFNYKSHPTSAKQYGLIAEDVTSIMPALVVFDKDGKPSTIRYHVLPALLLNEWQKHETTLQQLREHLKMLEMEQPNDLTITRGDNDRLTVGDGAGNNVLVVTNAGDFTLSKSGAGGATIIGASGGAVTINGTDNNAIAIGNATTTTNTIKGLTTTINAGTATSTTSIADGATAGTKTQTIKIGTGGTAATGAKTIQIASDGTALGTETIALGKTGVTTTILGTVNIDTIGTTTTYIGTSTSDSPVHIADSTAIGAVTIGNSTGKVGICGAVDAAATARFAGTTTISNGLTVSSNGIADTGDVTITSGNMVVPATTSTTGVIKVGSDNFLHMYGSTANVFLGLNAGNLTLTGGYNYVGIGALALNGLITTTDNTAIGSSALVANQRQSSCTAIGDSALAAHNVNPYTTACGYCASDHKGNSQNAPFGYKALSTGGGGGNTAIGYKALTNLDTGTLGTAIGYCAGIKYTGSESTNCLINHVGVAGESNVARIGTAGSGAGQQNACYIAGIRDVTTGTADAIAVLVDANGQLGTVSSARRFKENICDMNETSSRISHLRPVTFNYKGYPTKPHHYGLIAEEVLDVMPELVVFDADGKPLSVCYHVLPALLLNEFQKHHKTIRQLDEQLNILDQKTLENPTITRGVNDRLTVGDGAGNTVFAVTKDGNLTLSKSGAGATIIDASSGVVTINGTASDAVAIGNATTTTNDIKGITNAINAGTVTSTTSIADGTTAASNTQTVKIGTGGTASGGTKTIQIVSTGTASGTETIGLGKAGTTTTILGTTYINNSGTAATYIGTSTTASPVHIADDTAIGAVTIGNATGKVGIGGAVDATAKLKITGTTNITDTLTVAASGIAATGNMSIASGNLILPATTSSVGIIKFNTNNIVKVYGTDNLFIGNSSGNFTLSGFNNIGIGNATIDALTTGSSNIGIGANVLSAVTSGACNTGVGAGVLQVATGNDNTAVGGSSALSALTTGNHNTALGSHSLVNNTTGSYNTCIGHSSFYGIGVVNSCTTLGIDCGRDMSSGGSNNIYMLSRGAASQNNVISIGAALTKCFIAGIYGTTTINNDAVAVLIDSTHQLGTTSSSRQVKENIRPIGNESSLLMQLRPVTFNYKNQESKAIQYGLIAEEVAEIMPDLVVYDSDKKPWSVRYHDLPILLCNEYQKQHAAIATLSERIQKKSRLLNRNFLVNS